LAFKAIGQWLALMYLKMLTGKLPLRTLTFVKLKTHWLGSEACHQ
jgi:hypothetical protein